MSQIAALLPQPLPSWLAYALQFDGQREIPGIHNNPTLMKVLDEADGVVDGKTVGANNDDEAYCAKGTSGILEHVGIRSTRSAWARSYASWGVELPGPAVGCIVVMERGPKFGHVTQAIGRDAAGNLICFGFNQGDAVKASAFETKRIIGYRWPKGIPLPPVTSFLKLPLLAITGGKVSSNEA